MPRGSYTPAPKRSGTVALRVSDHLTEIFSTPKRRTLVTLLCISSITEIKNSLSHLSHELAAPRVANTLVIFVYAWYNINMVKDIILTMPKDVTHGRGYVYSLQYHIVWTTKYRKSIFIGGQSLFLCDSLAADPAA